MFNKIFTKSQSAKSDVEKVEAKVMAALNQYRSAIFPEGIVRVAKQVNVQLSNNHLIISLTLPFPCISELSLIGAYLAQDIDYDIEILPEFEISAVRNHSIKGVKNIIAIASGKGGVGKSTTAVNLAYALIAEGAKVGILDADIYGPSIPTMLGVALQKPESTDGKKLSPIMSENLASMSIGYLTEKNDATVWRGPMASTAFNQLLTETSWPDIDYLIVDMPPGTGDIQLTLAQKVPVAGAIVITTPQDIAAIDAAKGIAMFDKVKVPVLGVIENMSYHQCTNCGHHSLLFGEHGGENLAKQFSIDLLGQLPLNIDIRRQSDSGKCVVLENSTSEIALNYRKIAQQVASKLFYALDIQSPFTAELIINED